MPIQSTSSSPMPLMRLARAPRVCFGAILFVALALGGAERALAADSPAADEALRKGERLVRKGRFAEAIPAIEHAAELAGGRTAKIDVALARAYAGAGQRDNALAAANDALAAGAEGDLEKAARILRCENRPPAPPDAAEPRQANDPGVVQPEVVQRINPGVPRDLRRRGNEGNLIAEVVIDEQGCVTDARLTRATGTSMDQAALDAMRRWVFRPATYEGQPVKVRYILTTSFQVM
jgi:TonB family protein